MNRLPTALLLAVVASIAYAAPVPKVGKQPVYYPLKPGTVWEYKVGGGTTLKLAVTGVTRRDGATVAISETQVNGRVVSTERLAVTDKGVFREAINKTDVIPPVQFLRYPVRAGDKWDVKSVMGADVIDVAYTVREPEEVIVPAGKFKAVRVDSSGNVAGTLTDLTYWFAPDVGVVKLRYTIGGFDSVLELNTFTLGKD